MLKITYDTDLGLISEFVCPQHSGYAGQRAHQWIKNRFSSPLPHNAETLLSRLHKLEFPTELTVHKPDRFYEVLSWHNYQRELLF
jgi:DNA repair protein RadD